MKRILHHRSEVEYDFSLKFWGKPLPKCGDQFQRTIQDDFGARIYFAGVAVVVATETTSHDGLEIAPTEVFFKHYPPIE